MSVACTHRYTSETIAKRNHEIIIERIAGMKKWRTQ